MMFNCRSSHRRPTMPRTSGAGQDGSLSSPNAPRILVFRERQPCPINQDQHRQAP